MQTKGGDGVFIRYDIAEKRSERRTSAWSFAEGCDHAIFRDRRLGVMHHECSYRLIFPDKLKKRAQLVLIQENQSDHVGTESFAIAPRIALESSQYRFAASGHRCFIGHFTFERDPSRGGHK